MAIVTRDLPGSFGVEVEGFDPSEQLSEALQCELRQIWLDRGLVLFRGMGKTPEAQLNLSRCFGELALHPIESLRDTDHPELIWFSNKEKRVSPVYYYDDKRTLSRLPWHTDKAYTTEIATGGLLRMIEMPPEAGGTTWADLAGAYDALSTPMRERLEGLEVLLRFILDPCDLRFARHPNVRPETEGEDARAYFDYPDLPDVIYPLVLTHPETGRKSLNLSPLNLRFIVNMAQDEGDALLEELVAHATSPVFNYHHQWQPHDMAIWDNRRSMHCTDGFLPEHVRSLRARLSRGRVKSAG